jgi:hypothetical protein
VRLFRASVIEPRRAPAHLFHPRTAVGDDCADCNSKEQAMTAPNATPTNGRHELPPPARGLLVLADPPEAGWRLQPTANEPASADRKPFAVRRPRGFRRSGKSSPPTRPLWLSDATS